MQPKLKLLKILDILRETNPTNPITAPAICKRLAEMGIQAERKSVCRDINTLIEYGYNISLCHDNKLGYYMDAVDLPPQPVTLDIIRVTVEYKKENKELVASVMGKGKEEEDGDYIIAELGVPSSSLFANLFTLGDKVKLTAPIELKEEFERKLGEVSDFYKKRRDSGKIEVWLL